MKRRRRNTNKSGEYSNDYTPRRVAAIFIFFLRSRYISVLNCPSTNFPSADLTDGISVSTSNIRTPQSVIILVSVR